MLLVRATCLPSVCIPKCCAFSRNWFVSAAQISALLFYVVNQRIAVEPMSTKQKRRVNVCYLACSSENHCTCIRSFPEQSHHAPAAARMRTGRSAEHTRQIDQQIKTEITLGCCLLSSSTTKQCVRLQAGRAASSLRSRHLRATASTARLNTRPHVF